ncbi:MAG: hypothetical protein QXH30_01990 [Candidatus Bilamarchaeaceae archaeon]
MQNRASFAFWVFLAVCIFAFSGCASGEKAACNKTTDCAPDEICSKGFCEKPACRSEGQTCDEAPDCCEGMGCKENKCAFIQCTENCNDGNPCTTDSCNTSSGQCAHSTIHSCCGNGICESGENCASCANDCGCAAGEVCAGDVCIKELDYRLSQIEGNATIEGCRQKVLNEWKLKGYDAVMVDAEACAGLMADAKGELEALQNRGGINESQREKIAAASLAIASKQEEMYGLRFLAETYKKRETMSKYAYDNLAYLEDLKNALSRLEMAMYNLYVIKRDFPAEWKEGTHKALFDEEGLLYEGVNQQINALYDGIGNYYYKYAFQVDPNDPLVIEIVEEVNSEHPLSEVPQALLELVYNSVEYSPDPAGNTGWVQPPAYTMMVGKGADDDSAILLASLLKRAGIAGVNLCLFDSPNDLDRSVDHMAAAIVYAGGHIEVYESSWTPEKYLAGREGENETLKPRPVSKGEYPAALVECFYPEEVVSYALAGKCSDGTLYGQCSKSKPWFCTEEGTFELRCEKCGCPEGVNVHCGTYEDSKGHCIQCQKASDIWIEKYSVCCPKGYGEYLPDEEKCRWTG